MLQLDHEGVSSVDDHIKDLTQPKTGLGVKQEVIAKMLRSNLTQGKQNNNMCLLSQIPNLCIMSNEEIRGFLIGKDLCIEFDKEVKPIRQS